ncbi:MAG TPA: hypothetical protein PKJ63_08115 [Cyclobacteriaceae bacterium]|nr:hypothetical protein [Cyclobacteriaceae bacterium]
MWRYFLVASIGSTITVGSYGQIKKQFSVEDRAQVEKVELKLSTKTGNCYIRPSQNSDLLNVYSNQDIEDYGHAFSNEIINKTCFVSLSLEQDGRRGVGQKISYQVFGGDDRPSDKFWKVYLTEAKPYALALDYGLGNANIDLSGLSIKQLKIKTGSADVNVFYSSGIENQMEMDTFFVKVDMGSLQVRQLNLAKSRVVMADVGFGNILLDFSDRPSNSNHVKGSVGAGNLVILLPGPETPVKVKINNSWLCSLDLCKSLKRVGENTFVNTAFENSDTNALTFDLDVSLGKIVFKDKSE